MDTCSQIHIYHLIAARGNDILGDRVRAVEILDFGAEQGRAVEA